MKELSIEEKAKAYDDALRKVKDMLSYKEVRREDMEYIFPELAESEDERIRKEIINFLEHHPNIIVKKERKNDWIAWLEKQGEQKPTDKVEPKFKVGDIVKHKDNPHLTYILKRFTDDGDYEFHAIGKDGHEGCTCFSVVKYQDKWELVEQKPTVEMKTPEESLGIDSDTYNKIVDECVYGEQNPAWSEEDEENLNWFEKFFRPESLITKCKDIPQDKYLWFKSLKDRVQPQPKQEWSEEDEKKIRTLLSICDVYSTKTSFYPKENKDIEILKDWLKSLRPQNTWKPSEEQIEALLKLEEMHVLEHEKNQENAHLYMMVKSIREQLLKLREK